MKPKDDSVNENSKDGKVIRKNYEVPHLRTYGTVDELTAGGGGTRHDTAANTRA
ncbi:MAG: hypothetical protein HY645_03920 [Acidobacteria bacterium]|nr:hypothetical protein [Acidobacteriota bacterium]